MTIPAGTLVPRDARDFGRYELIAKLATGGMAEIYLARRQGSSKREVSVLKRILPHLAEDEHFVTMFRDEAELASKLLHPNVCRVDALDHHAGTWFIEMEYLHGIALSRIMTQLAKMNKMLDPRIVTGIIVQACEGLHHAHELRGPDDQLLNVVHRDVSPPNIMLTDTGVVKLLDFGIAKARGANSKTRTGTVKGKNAYMSPEQILGRPLDRRSDIFALGTVMYEMLAIKRLFQRDSDFLTFKAITEEPIPDIKERRPDLAPALRSVITQALARDPHGRFGSAKTFADAIRAAMGPLGGPATRSELSKFLATDFSDELASRAEILAAANEGAAPVAIGHEPTGRLPAPSTPPPKTPVPSAGAAGSAGAAPASAPIAAPGAAPVMRAARPTGPVPNWPPTANLEPVDGELEPRTSSPSDASNLAPSPTSVPTMIIKDSTVPVSAGGIELATLAASGDGGTDLLRAYRRRSLLRFLLVGGVIALLVMIGVWWTSRPSPDAPDDRRPPDRLPVLTEDAARDAGAVDAGRPPVMPLDAGLTRDQIIAMSKYGRYSVDASPAAAVFIGEKKAGDTPLVDYQLPPGIHQVRLVSGKKVKRFEITVLGGQSTNDGLIEW
ncbi:MAG: serine/threonine protein kinase [Myxococcales bacterium]|nr:serine/threonine protein kinase [Myxococcales bacterium]